MLKHKIDAGSFLRKARNKTVITAFSLSLLLINGCGQQQQQDTQLLGNFSLDVPIAYVKRPIDPINDVNPLGDPRNPFHFTPGGNLYYRAVAASDSPEVNITDAITAADPDNNKDTAGDVADPSVSYDGKKIVFAMKIGEFNNLQPEEQPTWNIWEYNITDGSLNRVISGDIKAEEGNDMAPAYLPDGRIVFLSDRQTQSKQFLTEYGHNTDSYLDESRRQPAAVLHVMNADGSNIQQISFNQSDDLDPNVLRSGKIVFSRWEHANGRDQVDIFNVNPDGSDLNILYGAYSHATADGSDKAFVYPREMPDGRLIANVMPSSSAFDRGDMVLIDYKNYVDINTPMINSSSSQSQGQVSVTGGQIPVTSGLSRYGRYADAFPLWDGTNRLLVSWSPCLAQLDNGDSNVVNPNPVVPCPSDTTGYVEATPLYHVVIVDLDHKTQKPIVPPEDGMAILQPVALVDRSLSLPTIIPDKANTGELDTQMVADNVGAIDIRSVYDTTSFTGIGMQAARLFNDERLPCNTSDFSCADGDTVLLSKIANPDYVTVPFSGTVTTVPRRPARFVRIITAVPTPPMIDRSAFGVRGNEMREIAGYAPVEPDGSVYTEVPANVPFAVEVVDDQGRKFHGHDNWMQVIPGETLKCNGCHSPSDGTPSINAGADAIGSSSYLNSAFSVNTAMANMNVSVPQQGDTMAETNVRLSCETGNLFCDARKLSSDLEYTDLWTPASMTAQTSYAIKYSDATQGLFSAFPIRKGGSYDPANIGNCVVGTSPSSKWSYDCRIVINYLDHIQPLWDRERWLDAAGNLTTDSAQYQTDVQCISCHTTNNNTQVPPSIWQLDLDNNDSPAGGITTPNDTWVNSYQELTTNSGNKFYRVSDGNGGIIPEERCVDTTVTNADGTTTTTTVCTNDQTLNGHYNVNSIASPVVPFSARRSYLIEKMTETELGSGRDLTPTSDPTYVDHSKMMTAAEIRLLSEWIDLGAPYYSDPYVVPMN